MAKFDMQFSLLTVVACIGFMANSFAAPSVKRLGTGNSYTGTVNAVAAKNGSMGKNAGTASVRSASVRNVGGGTVKSATTGKTSSITNNANTSRLSVGKYLHVAGTKAGIIKPINPVSPGNSSIDANVLNNYYTKSETYTRSEIDSKFRDLPGQDNYYTKDEIDAYRDGLDGVYAQKTTVETLTTAVNGDGSASSGLLNRVAALENGHVAGESASSWCDDGPAWAVATDPKCD